jgi:hypothetical protein
MRRTLSDQARFAALVDMGCILCDLLGFGKTPPQIHHIRSGQGMALRATHQQTIPLCPEHHQGGTGVHGMGVRAWERYHGCRELDLLELVNERLREVESC